MMKNGILFKTLIDILFILHAFLLLGVFFVLPYGGVKINQVDTLVQDWSALHWSVYAFSLMSYIIFLRGLYFLRKMARFYLNGNFFNTKSIIFLKKAGYHFLITGGLMFLIYFSVWISHLFFENTIQLVYDNDVMLSFLLLIIGLFFVIQSKAMEQAKRFKEENELTV